MKAGRARRGSRQQQKADQRGGEAEQCAVASSGHGLGLEPEVPARLLLNDGSTNRQPRGVVIFFYRFPTGRFMPAGARLLATAALVSSLRRPECRP